MFWFLWSSGLCQGSQALWRDRNIMNASSAKWHRCKNSLYQLREHQCFPLTLQGKFDCVEKKRTETSMLLFLFLKISPPRAKALETSLQWLLRSVYQLSHIHILSIHSKLAGQVMPMTLQLCCYRVMFPGEAVGHGRNQAGTGEPLNPAFVRS